MDDLSAVPEDQRHIALQRFKQIRAFLEDEAPLPRVAASAHVPLRTAQRWVTLYRRYGLAGLVRKRRADDGQRRLSGQMIEFVEGLALQKPPPAMRSIHRHACGVAHEQNARAPRYWQVREIVRNLPSALTTLAHEGTKAYHQAFDLVHRREADGPNAIWQADHTPLDILLFREGQAPAKPWLTIVIDDYSRAIAGYLLSFDAPSALHTSLALRQAIWRKEDPRWHICGIPALLYSDNGSDFTSQHPEQVSADLKIQLVFSTPGMPRGRGRVERFFDTLNQMLLSPLPGYNPPGGAVRGVPKLTLRSFEPLLLTFLLDTYHVRVHSETGVPPQERWEAGGFLPQMPASLEQLDLLLLAVAKARKVHPDGIRFQGLRYMDLGLAAYVGEEVIIRYDPRDIAEVRVFHDNRFLCRAVCQELAGETVPLREIIRARNQRRRDLRQTIRERQRTVDALLGARHWATEEEPEVPPAVEPAPDTRPLKRYLNE
jgi:putative transposase